MTVIDSGKERLGRMGPISMKNRWFAGCLVLLFTMPLTSTIATGQPLRVIAWNSAEFLAGEGFDTSDINEMRRLVDTTDRASYIGAHAAIFLAERGMPDIKDSIISSYYRNLSAASNFEFEYLYAVSLIDSALGREMVHSFLDTLILREAEGVPTLELGTKTYKALRLLCNMNDYSRYSLLSGLTTACVSSGEGWIDFELLEAYSEDASLRDSIIATLAFVATHAGEPSVRIGALSTFRRIGDGAEVQDLLRGIAVNDSSSEVTGFALGSLAAVFDDYSVVPQLMNRATASTDTIDLSNTLSFLEGYRNPYGLRYLELVRDALPPGPGKDLSSRFIRTYAPGRPPEGESKQVSIDSLIDFTAELFELGWVLDSTFVASLQSSLSTAAAHLRTGDSVAFAREIRYLRRRVSKEHVDSLDADGDVVTLQGWQFLYHNASYLLAGLPGLPRQYHLDVTANANGTVDRNPNLSWFDAESTVVLTAVPSTGYHFSDWSGDLTGSNNHSVTASFSVDTFFITASAGPNGTVSLPGPSQVTYGGNLTYTITSNTGYSIDSLLVDNVLIASQGTYTFTNVTASHTIRAVFRPNQYAITATAGTNGTLTPSGAVLVNYAATQVFTVTPNACYRVDSVIVDDVNMGTITTYTFANVIAPHTIRTVYRLNTYVVTPTSGSNGSISPSSPTTVNCGANLTFTLTPSTGYHIDSVIINGTYRGTGSSYTFTNVRGDSTIRAVFRINQYAITATSGSNGSISPSGTVQVNHGTSQAFTITPSSCYHVDSVIVDNVNQGAITSYTFTNVTAAHSIRTVYRLNTYVITPTAGANGSINPSSATTVNCGANLSFTITPATGYHVDSLIIDGAATTPQASYSFTNVTVNHNIRAAFRINSYTLTLLVDGEGRIVAIPELETYTHGASVVLKAMAGGTEGPERPGQESPPPSSWRFDHWEVDASGTTTPVTVVMDRNKTVRAVFVPEE
jgi:hypothetical protein